MKIITDNPVLARQLTRCSQWTEQSSRPESRSELTELLKRVFPHNPDLFYGEMADDFWNYFILTEHSKRSQYELLKEMSGSGRSVPDRLICAAGSGNNFKGFRNRSWEAVPGNLHISISLSPDQPVQNFFRGFMILAAVSVIQALEEVDGLQGRAAIKWVNDIFIDNAKVAGVLSHTQSQGNRVTSAVLGIGINVETVPKVKADPFVPGVTSVNSHLPAELQTTSAFVLEHLLKHLAAGTRLLLKDGYERLLQEYRKSSMVLNRKIQIFSDPPEGRPEFLKEGKVQSIGQHLELFLEGEKQPVTKGRLVLLSAGS